MNKHLRLAIEKFNNSEFFECHDILEDYWFECRIDEKDFYQGLLHYAVAYHHVIDNSNPAGAKLQFTKCIKRLSRYNKPIKGIDAEGIIRQSKKNLGLLNKNTPDKIKHIKIKLST